MVGTLIWGREDAVGMPPAGTVRDELTGPAFHLAQAAAMILKAGDVHERVSVRPDPGGNLLRAFRSVLTSV